MRKAQLKIGESIAVLFIFFVLVVMGVIFWSKYSQSSMKEKTEEETLTTAVKISQTVSYLPELQCSAQEVIKFNCFDLYKMQGMKALMTSADYGERAKLHYFDTLSFSNITIVSIYPNYNSINIYDRPYVAGGPHSYRTTQVPVAVLNTTSGQYSFGYLDVRVYTR